MQKHFLIIILILTSGLTYGQTNSGKIIYNVSTSTDFNQWVDSITAGKKMAAKMVKKEMTKVKKTMPYLSFNLTFNSSQSLFEISNTMNNDNGINLKSTASTIGASGSYYTDIQKHINLKQFTANSQKWLLQSNPQEFDWEISNETKKIEGYTCKKATTYIRLNNQKKIKVTAWFAPELPFQFGPLEFSGLPGLILAVKRNHYYFYAASITLSKEKKNITKPVRGKLITQEEFSEEYNKVK